MHPAPPHEGAGLLHARVLVREEEPHVGAQTPIDHDDHAPLTGQQTVCAAVADPGHAAVEPQYCPHDLLLLCEPQVGSHELHVVQALYAPMVVLLSDWMVAPEHPALQ